LADKYEVVGPKDLAKEKLSRAYNIFRIPQIFPSPLFALSQPRPKQTTVLDIA
jgi:hypothetical protein